MNLSDILKDSEYKLSQFKPDEVAWLEQTIFLKSSAKGDVPYIKCLVRGKEIKLTPEEAVRQLYLKVLCDRYHYPVNRILVEYEVSFGREKKRADIAIMDKERPNVPYIIVELKKPKLKDGKDQLRSYCNATGSPIGVWTNGDQISFYQRKDPNYFEDITDIPNVSQTLADILNERFTLVDLIKKDKLVTEKKSLKALILEMEDEVLANAGVDVFEELFILIFTKLYDEWESGRDEKRKKTRLLEFRNTGQTDTELKIKIQGLFDRAKKKWEGVFKESDKITLSSAHLSVCVSSLENVKLFNSNLDVVDEAFEYLINQSSKGEKGQYFTPRYVIDMCVKMLNPQEDEAIIDTAAGSSGFPVHTIFHVWQQIIADEGLQVSNLFSLEKKPARCEDYVKGKVFAIDFDEKAVRVSRTLNLIAGDGETNVLHLNTLDYESWKERSEEEDWRDVYGNGFKRLRGFTEKKNDFKSFQFDIVMANPPFAGEIKESRITSKYDLAVKANGKRQEKMGRDILFIERNLDFLKAGGRMAVVLPQGRFNNSSDKYIRDFIAERCRILAVVGLHGNTFKPHTGTKTSVLFVQKWNDDPRAGALCPRQDDYNIFFVTMRKSGKDNSGDKVYVKRSPVLKNGKRSPLTPLKKGGKEEEVLEVPLFKGDLGGSEFLLDSHGHLIVDHDLFNHDGLTEDGIAEAFIEFAKKENLSFFDLSSSVTPFDADKYDRLMDELEVSSVKLSLVLNDNDSFRFDSEYFQKIHLKTSNLLKKFAVVKVSEIAKVSDGDHSKFPDNQKQEVKYLQAKDIKNYFLEEDNPVYISRDYFLKNSRSHIEGENILLSIMGTVGDITITPKDFEPCLSNRALAIIKNIKLIDPYFLFAYLITNQTTVLIDRLKNGGVQERVNLDALGKVEVPLMTEAFQKLIRKIVVLGYKTRDSAKSIYQKAEDLLLSELGLKDWQPTDENIAVKSFSASFGTSDRLDAEYYQPNQQKIMSVMAKSGLCINDVANLAKRKFTPKLEGTFEYIEIGNLSGEGVANSDVVPMEEAPSRAQWIVKPDDVITSTVRPIRRLSALIEREQNGYVCSSGFAVLQPTKVEPEVLLVYLRLPVVCEILDLHTTASMYPAISTEDLLKIPITLPEPKTRKQISEKVQSSRKAREQSKKLLEIAKTGVEKAIEENEELAINWINQQLKKL